MKEDMVIQNRWLEIKIGKVGDIGKVNSKARKRVEAKWEIPELGWLKVNFDGASKGNLGSLGAVCIVRYNFGNTVGS